MSKVSAGICMLSWITIIAVVRILVCRRKLPRHAPSRKQRLAGSSRSQRSVDSIIATSAAQPEVSPQLSCARYNFTR